MTLVGSFLQHYWSFDYQNYADSVGRLDLETIPLAPLSASINCVSDRFGNEEFAASFNGISLTTADNNVPSVFKSGYFTITAWFYFGYTGEMGTSFFQCFQKQDPSKNSVNFALNANGKIFFSLVKGVAESIVSSTLLQSNKWNHVSLTYSQFSKKACLFVNGVLDSGGCQVINAVLESIPIDKCKVGITNLNQKPIIIDELKIYNAALTDSQILKDMYAQNGENGQYIPDPSNA
jgi:hypothetical protein